MYLAKDREAKGILEGLKAFGFLGPFTEPAAAPTPAAAPAAAPAAPAAPAAAPTAAPTAAAPEAAPEAASEEPAKKPLSAYMMYCAEARPALKGMKVTEQAKQLGAQWKALDPTVKNAFEEAAKAAKHAWELANPDAAKKKPAAKKNGRAPRAKKDPNAPKKPLSAYIIFSKERRASVVAENPGMKVGEVAKVLGARWKAIGAEEKSVFEAKAKEDKVRYQAEMEAYVPTTEHPGVKVPPRRLSHSAILYYIRQMMSYFTSTTNGALHACGGCATFETPRPLSSLDQVSL